MDPDLVPKLPPELVLLVVEFSARDAINVRQGWVAGLCLVCQSVRVVVVPILYAHITVTRGNIIGLVALVDIPETPLTNTRSVLFRDDIELPGTSQDSMSHPVFASLARGFVNLRSYSGSSVVLAALLNFTPFAHVTSVFIGDALPWTHETGDITRLVKNLSRLRIVWDLTERTLPELDLMSSRLEYLIIDVLADVVLRGDEPAVHKDLNGMDALTSNHHLHRILFRPRCYRERDAQMVAEHVRRWAVDNSDRRVWIDDSFVPVVDEGSLRYPYAKNEEDDALAGDALWLCGRQAWSL
ncbi:hypothetical protein EXIGLDRAFT_729210 [Exidia glandulosa HHB12029]|uniref:F-box domain-containing protein n=1 Tax=Exidia glandulosa HHB12029 TaxID=1314781 RepID=A0A165LM69_EXIGL|nr:hypothetical protein EXIGLDRAFT_729210 [Exidia glandulosa HHB12029]